MSIEEMICEGKWKQVEARQKWENEEYEFDPDSSPEAWIHYKKFYKKIGNFDSLIKYKQEYMRLKSKVSVDDITYEIAGDCSFNFNNDKVKELKEIVNDDSDISYKEKMKLIDQLEECNKMHHTLLNFNLIPVTGGMNNLKAKLKYKYEGVMVHDVGRPPEKGMLDRLDTFIYFLDYSFKKINEFKNCKYIDLKAIGEFFNNSVFTSSMRSENFSVLYDLLVKFVDIYEYCDVYYNIDSRRFVKKLIENGKKPITNAIDIKNYIILANEFWDIKEQYFNAELKKNIK